MPVTLSAGVRQNLLSLQNTASLMSSTQSRLATGKRVNSSLDNPTNFFTSASLQSRANDLNALLDSMSNGIKTLEAADNGMTAVTKTVEQMQSTLRQARQDKSFQSKSYTIDTATIGTASTKNISFSGGAVGTTAVTVALNTLDVGGTASKVSTSAAYAAPTAAAAAAAVTGSVDLSSGLTGDKTFTVTAAGKTVSFTVDNGWNTASTIADGLDALVAGSDLAGKIDFAADGNNIKISAVGNYDGKIEVAGTDAAAVWGAATQQSATAGSDGKTEFSINGTAVSLTTTTGADLTTAIGTINDALGATSTFEAYDAGSSKLGIRAKAVGVNPLAITGADSGLFGAVTAGTAPTTVGGVKTVDTLVTDINANSSLKDKVRASNDNGKLRIENISTANLTATGISTDGKVDGSTGTSSVGGNDMRKNLVKQYNQLRDQLDKLADDSSFNGVNLLRGDKLKLTFNETSTSTIEIQAKDSSGAATSVNATTLGITNALDADFEGDVAIDSRLDKLTTALGTLRSHASTFGSNLSIVQNRTSFTKAMMSTLQTGADALMLADTNEEAANMLALQTRQQLSSTALSLASQADQQVLRLF